jgi:hypothetical protein
VTNQHHGGWQGRALIGRTDGFQRESIKKEKWRIQLRTSKILRRKIDQSSRAKFMRIRLKKSGKNN